MDSDLVFTKYCKKPILIVFWLLDSKRNKMKGVKSLQKIYCKFGCICNTAFQVVLSLAGLFYLTGVSNVLLINVITKKKKTIY